jgi:asparagine synthase (glutamine-hydrolysing)
VVELGAALPPSMKLRSLREKYLLRRTFGRHLPSSIVERPKQPYRAPDSESFMKGDHEYVEALLAPDAIARAGYFDPRAVRRLVQKCRNPVGPVSSGDNMAFVGILSTQLLHSAFVRPLI